MPLPVWDPSSQALVLFDIDDITLSECNDYVRETAAKITLTIRYNVHLSGQLLVLHIRPCGMHVWAFVPAQPHRSQPTDRGLHEISCACIAPLPPSILRASTPTPQSRSPQPHCVFSFGVTVTVTVTVR